MTTRDLEAYKFIKLFRMARLEQIDKVAYNNYQVCCNRMRRLAKDGLVTRVQDKYRQGLLYSVIDRRSMKQYLHYMLRNETYLKLLELSDSIEQVEVEPIYGSVQPDMMLIGSYKGEKYFFLVECETEVNMAPINTDKYNQFFIKEWREHFNAEPTVLYVTEKKVDADRVKYNYQMCQLDLSNMEEVLQGAKKY